MPLCREFYPTGEQLGELPIILTLDEYETIRLIDKEGFSQEECSNYMQVARTTVQLIYNSARSKLAEALVEGLVLRIEGGDYELCDGKRISCECQRCFRHQHLKEYEREKGAYVMRVAVTYENGQVFQHFGHTQQFKVYDIEEQQILSSEVVDTKGSGHGALAGVLDVLKVDVLICGGIGGGAQNALTAAGIRWYGGVCGDADEAVKAFLNGNLEYDPNVKCNHHDHQHGEGHTCGEHGCGGHTCGA